MDKEADLTAAANAEQKKQTEAALSHDDKAKALQRERELRRRAAYFKGGFSMGFRRSVNDLLSEANDGKPDFYRFQMIGWTLALGIIFVRTVYFKLAMPEFSNEQLLLMGISNGTYLGFKYARKPDNNPQSGHAAQSATAASAHARK
jgi:predicted lipase